MRQQSLAGDLAKLPGTREVAGQVKARTNKRTRGAKARSIRILWVDGALVAGERGMELRSAGLVVDELAGADDNGVKKRVCHGRGWSIVAPGTKAGDAWAALYVSSVAKTRRRCAVTFSGSRFGACTQAQDGRGRKVHPGGHPRQSPPSGATESAPTLQRVVDGPAKQGHDG